MNFNPYKISENFILKKLHTINNGRLVLENYNGNTYNFGNQESVLKANIKINNPKFYFNIIRGGSNALAESYIKQIDKKQKQVAMSIKIMDVNIDDNKDLTNSFATRLSDPKAYILSDEGNFDLVLGSIDSWKTNRATGVSTLDLSNASKFDFVTFC